MDLLPNDEQRQIEDMAEKFVSDRFPLERLVKAAATQDAAAWKEMAGLGLFGIGTPESAGGAGLGITEEILVARALGRQLVSPSALASGRAAGLAAQADKSELAAALVAGERRAIFLLRDDSLPENCLAIDAAEGDLGLSLAPDGLWLYEIRTLGQAVDCLDESIRLFPCLLGTEIAREIGNSGAAALGATLVLAASLVGLAEQAYSLAVAHAGERRQFGQPIGAFQAVKHSCANMKVSAEIAWWQVVMAAITTLKGGVETVPAAASASFLARRAAIENASAAIQVFGGMGFTADSHPHRLLKRARLVGRLAGDPRSELETVAAGGGLGHKAETAA